MLTAGCLIAVGGICSCSLVPEYMRPDMDMPQEWSSSPYEEETAAAAPAPLQAISPQWWESFSSKTLNRLVETGLKENNTVQAGFERIKQSKATLRTARSSLLPSLQTSGGVTRSRFENSGGDFQYSSNLNLGVDLFYDLDLFGRNKASYLSSKANLKTAELREMSLRLQLAGNVTKQYLNILSLQQRLDIANKNIEIAQNVLDIVKARYDAGREGALVVSQQTANVSSSMAAQRALQEQLKRTRNALAVLIGRAPQGFVLKTDSIESLAKPNYKPVKPEKILSSRPDILALEYTLIAANADIGAARAAFYPNITMGLGTTVAASGLDEPFLRSESLFGSVFAPLFQGGQLDANLERSRSRRQELIYTYHEAILNALKDVEDAMISLNSEQDQRDKLLIAAREARKSYDLSKALYDSGSVDFLTLLDAQRTLLGAENSLSQSQLNVLVASVDLFLATGGGWVE